MSNISSWPQAVSTGVPRVPPQFLPSQQPMTLSRYVSWARSTVYIVRCLSSMGERWERCGTDGRSALDAGDHDALDEPALGDEEQDHAGGDGHRRGAHHQREVLHLLAGEVHDAERDGELVVAGQIDQ